MEKGQLRQVGQILSTRGELSATEDTENFLCHRKICGIIIMIKEQTWYFHYFFRTVPESRFFLYYIFAIDKNSPVMINLYRHEKK